MTDKRYEDETTDYRRGFVEGQSGERDAYLLCSGCTNIDDYNRGFLDGIATQMEGDSMEDAFSKWLDEQIEEADTSYRQCPTPDMAIRPLVLKHVASQYRTTCAIPNQQEVANEPATEEWIRQRWGGFDYLDLARNEDFSLYFVDGKLTLRYETLDEWGSDIVLFEKPSQQNVIDAERIFGVEIDQ